MKSLQDVLALQDKTHRLCYILYPHEGVRGLPGMVHAQAFFSVEEWPGYRTTQNIPFQNNDADRGWLAMNGFRATSHGVWYKFQKEEVG